ncbi:MAG: DNA cytosine methyltransferase [Thermoproteota archaeon]
MTGLLALDLFCGCGGFSLGFEMAGIDVLAGVDIDGDCLKTYARNLRGKAIQADIAGIKDPEEFVKHHLGNHDIDIIFGSPPCQPFSPAGIVKLKSLGVDPSIDPRLGLWQYFVKFVISLKPCFFVMENVPGFLSAGIPDKIIEITGEHGYRCEVAKLDASKFGVPQKRRRVFVFGSLDGRIVLPEGDGNVVTVYDAISDLPEIPHGNRVNVMEYDRDPITDYQKRMREHSQLLYNHVTRSHNVMDLQIFALIPEGGTYLDVPVEMRRYRDDVFHDRYRRLRWDAPSWTLVAHMGKDTLRYVHPSQVRTISVREAARLQSFPDTFIFPVSMTKAFKQIGNAVPPLLARAVGESLVRCL